jgi:hypothetical protein
VASTQEEHEMTSGQGTGRSDELQQLADALRAVTRRVDDRGGEPLDRLAEATLDAIPAAEAVSLTVLERGHFETRASTHGFAKRADALQYELGRGPCVDAVLENTANISGDVAADPRWGDWGPRVAEDVGVRSALAYRLRLQGQQQAIASLNVYSTRLDAFDEQALHRGVVLATHGSLLMTAVMARDVAANLADTLQGNREIGVAMGVLMHRHRVTREQAFDLLRLASQESGTPLSEVATAVADAGDLTGLAPPLGTAVDEADPATS